MIRKPRWGRLAVTLLAAAAAAVVPAAASQADPAPDPCALAGVSTPATYDHVVVIFEENASFERVVGSANAPYFNQLAQSCALATNFHDVAGVSQPNYMAATGGQATGVGVKVNAPSIFEQVPSWLELEESMGGNCGGKSTFYKRGHDPAVWYTRIATQCKVSDIPAPTSNAGITTLPATMPAYTFITPNLCHNNHWLTGCAQKSSTAANLKAMDTWLQGTIQTIAATSSYQAGGTLILVAFDESSDKTTTRVPMIAVAAGVQPVADGTLYDQYALLRASEEALGITTFLGQAATANDMRAGMGF
ncbi:MAG TPA: alkaline phosphatase family protein [Gaiellales bacterium]|nr:alkaline phosphatase family protein [Gaiellales bacterium]